MGYKRIIRKIAKFILASQPDAFVQVNVGQIQAGNILQGKKHLHFIGIGGCCFFSTLYNTHYPGIFYTPLPIFFSPPLPLLLCSHVLST